MPVTSPARTCALRHEVHRTITSCGVVALFVFRIRDYRIHIKSEWASSSDPPHDKINSCEGRSFREHHV